MLKLIVHSYHPNVTPKSPLSQDPKPASGENCIVRTARNRLLEILIECMNSPAGDPPAKKKEKKEKKKESLNRSREDSFSGDWST